MTVKKTGKRLRTVYRDAPKGILTLYLVLRGLVLLCLVMQAVNGNWFNVLLCVLTLFLLLLPALVETTFKVQLPTLLEVTVLLFVFSAEILGEIGNFYQNIPHWDTVLHTITGFWAAGVGFSLVDLLNRRSQRNHLTPVFVALVAFCFSMTVGIVWEFFEFGSDRFLRTDMQKDRIVSRVDTVELDPNRSNTVVHIRGIDHTVMYDADGAELARIEGGYLDIGIIDTMKDLFVNFIGAVVFSVTGFFYARSKGEKRTAAQSFVPSKKTEATDYLKQAREESAAEDAAAPERAEPSNGEKT